MKYRALTPSGDYQFGIKSSFLVNTPATVAQAITTRMRLMAGEWFLDNRIGFNEILVLGYGTQNTRDQEVKRVILNTTGVLSLANYQSQVENRNFHVVAVVNTIYGQVQISEII